MGDWRRVQIIGTCGAEDIPKLKELLTAGDDYSNFHCLVHTGGICGLPNWACEKIEVVGNLAERGYDEGSVSEHLELLHSACPTLNVQIHVSDANESDNCIATVIAGENGVCVAMPLVKKIPQVDESQMRSNIIAAMTRR